MLGVVVDIKGTVRTRNMVCSKNMWILKPGENSNRGRGIQVASDWKEILEYVRDADTSVIVQKYIENPLLYQGRKFDMRMYALAAWVNGRVKLYFYESDYVRTSSFDYSLDTNDTFVHLTNEAIQIQHASFGKFERGNKVTLDELATFIKTVDPSVDFFKVYFDQMKVGLD